MSYYLQRMLTTERLMNAIDTVASTLIKLMVPGPRITEIKNDNGVMILRKHSADEMSTTSFSLPTKRGFDEGAIDIQYVSTTDAKETESKNVVYGIQASDASYGIDVMKIIVFVVGSLWIVKV